MTARVVAPMIVLAAGLVGVGGWLRGRLAVISVVGTSMQPTLEPGDRVLIRRTTIDRIRCGQIVVARPFRHTPKLRLSDPLLLIKRVAAVPGDPVPRASVPALAGVPEVTVPAGHFVVLGDDPAGTDSRQFGYCYADDLLGVVIRRLP